MASLARLRTSAPPSPAAGTPATVDWAQVWENRMLLRRGLAPDCAALWPEPCHAEAYQRSCEPVSSESVAASYGIGPGARMLDIGAGPGSAAVAAARFCSHVTAVEPSGGMQALLTGGAAAAGVENLRCIPKRWESIHADELLPRYDAVVAAFSLDMPDIRFAVKKMISVCRGRVHLAWFAGEPTWTADYRRLWPLLHGRQYIPSPKADILLCTLLQMGISPDVCFESNEFVYAFGGIDEAVRVTAPEFAATSHRQREILEAYLRRRLIFSDSGAALWHRYITVQACWPVSES